MGLQGSKTRLIFFGSVLVSSEVARLEVAIEGMEETARASGVANRCNR
jgi:hypothetical protein